MKFEFGTPNYDFLYELLNNPTIENLFNGYGNSKEIVSKIVNEKSEVIPFYKFCFAVTGNYPKQAEALEQYFNAALRLARTASNFKKALTTKKLYPNIKYQASFSANPSESHKKYYGIVRPIEDAFWDMHIPPNDFGCECRWAVSEEPVTLIPDNLPLPNEHFRFNPGKPETFKNVL